MTSKLVVNTIEADTGISSVSFASSISLSSTSKFFFSDAGIDIGADTNINRPASGVLGFNINGGEKVRITSVGRIGVGTDNPHSSYRFDIRHSADNILHLGQGAATLAGMANNSWNAISFQGTNCEFGLYKDGSGNFSYIMGTYQGSTAIPVIFRTGNRQERLRITSTGRINIGDTDQTQNVDQLSVTVAAQNALDNVARFQSNAVASGTSETLVKIYKGAGYGGVVSGYITQGSDHGLKFYTANNGTLSERLRLASSSNGRITHTGTAAANPAIDPYTSFLINDEEPRLQLCATDSGNNAAAIILSNESKHFVVHQRGPIQSNSFDIAYQDIASPTDICATATPYFRITTLGIINAPSQAGFYARMQNTKSSVMGGGASYYTVPFDTDSGSICYDTHNTYNTSTGLYTVPAGGTGHYVVSAAVCLSSNVYGRGGEIWFLVGSNRYFFDRRFMSNAGSGTITGFYGTSIIYLSAGQSIGVQGFISGGNQNVDVQGANATDQITWFTARKIA